MTVHTATRLTACVCACVCVCVRVRTPACAIEFNFYARELLGVRSHGPLVLVAMGD